MISYFAATAIFWLNYFPLSKPSAALFNIKGPKQIVLGTVVEYKNCCHIYPVKYAQVHQDYEPRYTVNIDI